MKKRKKIFAMVIVAVLAVQAAGCGKGQEEMTENPAEEVSVVAETESQEEGTTEEVMLEETPEEEIGVQFVAWEEAGLEDHVMDWKDEGLASHMQQLTGKEDGEEIMLSEVWDLTTLPMNGGAAISDISALSELTNITILTLWGSSVSDISALSGLTNLTVLDLSGNPISDISALSGLTNLTDLKLYDTSISDISGLSSLKNLESLNVCHNSISDFSVVAELTSLQNIYYGDNPIEDMSPLETASENGVIVMERY